MMRTTAGIGTDIASIVVEPFRTYFYGSYNSSGWTALPATTIMTILRCMPVLQRLRGGDHGRVVEFSGQDRGYLVVNKQVRNRNGRTQGFHSSQRSSGRTFLSPTCDGYRVFRLRHK